MEEEIVLISIFVPSIDFYEGDNESDKETNKNNQEKICKWINENVSPYEALIAGVYKGNQNKEKDIYKNNEKKAEGESSMSLS